MNPLRRLTLVLLVVLVLCGLGGGLALLTDPSGARLGLSVDALPAWPLLGNYLLPGLALILLFGLLPMRVAVLLFRRATTGWRATTAVGLILVVWMVVQLFAIGPSSPVMQAAFLVLGIVITGLGLDGAASVGVSDESPRSVRS